MQARGWAAALPELRDNGCSPYWRQHAGSVVTALPGSGPGFVLIAHSGAGPLLAAIADALPGRVAALLFVDAGLPEEGASRRDMLRVEMGEAFAGQFERHLDAGGRYPEWNEPDLAPLIEDAALRSAILRGQRPRPLGFFTEVIAAPPGWATLPAAYLQLSNGYDKPAGRATSLGWPVTTRLSNHFAILTRPAEVAADLEALLAQFALPPGP